VVKQKSHLILVVIVLVGLILRVFLLSSNPPSLTWDEASWGYNAYSLGIDGRDEFGKFLPITHLESFGDYKPPVYAYLTVPFIKLFGLNEFATRLPSALLGTATVLLTYLLTKKLFFSASDRKKEILALLSSVVLAISPWHILLSRAAFEANVATFFIVLGLYLFLVSLHKRWILPFSILSFVLSMYTFNTARVFVPILGIFLFFKYFKTLYKRKISLFLSSVFGFLIFLPLLLFLFTPEARLRYREVNIFSDNGLIITANQEMQNNDNALWSRIIHNRRVGYALAYIEHYLDNLDPQFLFIRGDGNPKFSIQDVGQMYIWEIPFFILGTLFLFRKREGYYLIIPVWILLGILPAGVARETPHALRIETILPTFQILTAYGLYSFFEFILSIKYQKSKKTALTAGRHIKYAVFSVLILFSTLNFLYFIHNYFVHYPKEYASQWQYGYKETVGYVNANLGRYDNVYVTDALGRPYIYFLFHLKYPPAKFRQDASVNKDAAGFTHVAGFSKFNFEEMNKGIDMSKKNLFIDDPGKLPGKIKVLKEFKQPDGETVLVAYERKLVGIKDEKLK